MTGLREDPRPRVLPQLHELPGLRGLPNDTESGYSRTQYSVLVLYLLLRVVHAVKCIEKRVLRSKQNLI